MPTTPAIGMTVLFFTKYDMFARSRYNPESDEPSAAIVLKVIAADPGATPPEPQKVNLIVFPDGREPVIRDGIPHKVDDAAFDKPYYKFLGEPETYIFGYGDVLADICGPDGNIQLYYTGELATGTILYTDAELTAPYTAHSALVNMAIGGITYSVNLTTGEITEMGAC